MVRLPAPPWSRRCRRRSRRPAPSWPPSPRSRPRPAACTQRSTWSGVPKRSDHAPPGPGRTRRAAACSCTRARAISRNMVADGEREVRARRPRAAGSGPSRPAASARRCSQQRGRVRPPRPSREADALLVDLARAWARSRAPRTRRPRVRLGLVELARLGEAARAVLEPEPLLPQRHEAVPVHALRGSGTGGRRCR